MKYLTIKQIKQLHSELIRETGGSDGLRDEGLLESAVYAPLQTFDGEALYPSIQQKAAKLGTGLIQNHPFVDGNKRTGIHVMLVFLAVNGIVLSYTQADLIQVGLALADSKMDDVQLLQWIVTHEL